MSVFLFRSSSAAVIARAVLTFIIACAVFVVVVFSLTGGR